MTVSNIQAAGGEDGILLPPARALRFRAPLTATYVPEATSPGMVGNQQSVRAYYEVGFGGGSLASALPLYASTLSATVATSYTVKIDGGTNLIEITSANTYLASATQIELDAPVVLVDGVIRMPEQAQPAAHATLGQLYYSSVDHKLHFRDSVANGSTDHALW